MPKLTPLTPEQRNAIADEIRAGMGRNAIARKHGVSAGSVTNIARREGLYFNDEWKTRVGSEAHRIDCELARIQREDQLLDEYLARTPTYAADGRETKGSQRYERRLSYKLYDLRRHHR